MDLVTSARHMLVLGEICQLQHVAMNLLENKLQERDVDSQLAVGENVCELLNEIIVYKLCL